MSDATRLPLASAKAALSEQVKLRLREFFQNKYVKNLIPILVPSALAAALFPFFGPIAAGTAAAVAVKNALALFKIDISIATIEKLIKPLEGKALTEDEMQEALQDTLQKLLPEDKKVNEEAAKALVTITPDIKEAALSNSKLDTTWLAESFETNLKQQGSMMAKIAPEIQFLLQKEGDEMTAGIQRLLHNWSHISLEVTATNKSKIGDLDLRANAAGGTIDHAFRAEDESTIDTVKTNFEIS